MMIIMEHQLIMLNQPLGVGGVAQSGSVIKVLSGNYVESNPIVVPAFVAVVGDDLRSVKVLPSNTTQDLFHVNKGCKLPT